MKGALGGAARRRFRLILPAQLTVVICVATRFLTIATPAAAVEPPGLADLIVKVCPALLLRSEAALRQLGTFDLSTRSVVSFAPRWTAISYKFTASNGHAVSVTFSEQVFPDATMATCRLLDLAGNDLDLGALKRALETDPDIRHLDGGLAAFSAEPNAAVKAIAWFKRPGSHPLFAVHVTLSKSSTVVTMTRDDASDKR